MESKKIAATCKVCEKPFERNVKLRVYDEKLFPEFQILCNDCLRSWVEQTYVDECFECGKIYQKRTLTESGDDFDSPILLPIYCRKCKEEKRKEKEERNKRLKEISYSSPCSSDEIPLWFKTSVVVLGISVVITLIKFFANVWSH